ncbi:MAG: arginine--tRNA ligase, partial [bacterium]
MTDIFSIKKTIVEGFRKALEDLGFTELSVSIEIPKEKGNGDFSSPISLLLSKQLKRPPMAIAEEIIPKLNFPQGFLLKAQAAPPGFINLTLNPEIYHQALLEAIQQDDKYGKNTQGAGQKILLEFVSANPTGPLNVVNARAAALGDSIGNLLDASGWTVEREYYVNDAGVQARLFGESLKAAFDRLKGHASEAPEGGYQGAYMDDLAREFD